MNPASRGRRESTARIPHAPPGAAWARSLSLRRARRSSWPPSWGGGGGARWGGGERARCCVMSWRLGCACAPLGQPRSARLLRKSSLRLQFALRPGTGGRVRRVIPGGHPGRGLARRGWVKRGSGARARRRYDSLSSSTACCCGVNAGDSDESVQDAAVSRAARRRARMMDVKCKRRRTFVTTPRHLSRHVSRPPPNQTTTCVTARRARGMRVPLLATAGAPHGPQPRGRKQCINIWRPRLQSLRAGDAQATRRARDKFRQPLSHSLRWC